MTLPLVNEFWNRLQTVEFCTYRNAVGDAQQHAAIMPGLLSRLFHSSFKEMALMSR